jgi:CubicO group peptidase (beta-lactamase class C family)
MLARTRDTHIARRAALRRIFGGVSCIAGLLVRPSVLPVAFRADRISRSEQNEIARSVENFRRRFEVPAFSMAIARSGQLAYRAAYGVVDSRQEAAPNNLFRIASVTKPITSTAIFTLIEQGRLRTESTVFGESGILGTRYGKQPYSQGFMDSEQPSA